MQSLSAIFRAPTFGGAALALAVAALASAPAAAATPFGKNLVKNPGAESGGPGPEVPDWEISPDLTVETYGTPGLPSKKQGKSIDGEKQLFSTGPYVFNFDTCGSALQSIKLKGISGDIDGGGVKLTLSAALGTEGKSDTAYVDLQFRDRDNHAIGSNVVLSASTKAKMTEKTKTVTVPKGTRIIRLLLQGDLIAQTCNAFFDNVSVVLD